MRSANKRRHYRLGRRADSAAATRRRIVEATLQAHDEQGITRTSVRDVAQRAGVSPATVLNHFPHMGDLIRACGRLSNELAPMPTAAVLVGARDRRERVRLAALAMFAWWDQLGPGWDHLRIDRRTLPEVDAWLRATETGHRTLMAEALGPAHDPGELALLVALTTPDAWRSLRDAGMDPDVAAAEVARRIGHPQRRREERH